MPMETRSNRSAPEVWRTPISADTANDVQAMMVDAVESGLIQAAQIPGIRVGGKTGTAEVTDQRPHSWFIGFAGESQPRFAVSVLLENGGRGQGTSLDIGREMLALATGSGVADTESSPACRGYVGTFAIFCVRTPIFRCIFVVI